jgi:hypothetical protein
VPLQKLPLEGARRAYVTTMTGLIVVGYVILVYLIFFLTYTPISSPHVLGVQGRYFIIVLPAAAIFLAGVITVELPRGAPAAIATIGSLIAGIASVEAMLRAHW